MSQKTQYFRKFPLTSYNGMPAVNIVKRVAFNENVENFISAFYTYTLSKDEKIDHLAFNYYDDVDYDWLIYHANDIVDPFYDVPLESMVFESYIAKKYGSREIARETIVHYKNNYAVDESILTTNEYNNLLPERKKYWEPIEGFMGIAGYQRSKEDISVSTNKIEGVEYVTVTTNHFQTDEKIKRADDSSTEAIVAFANTSAVVFKHVTGDFTSNTNYTIVGQTSGVSIQVAADTHTTIQQTIPENELIYYKAVSAYEYEEELNESKRSIKLVEDVYKQNLNKQLDTLLR